MAILEGLKHLLHARSWLKSFSRLLALPVPQEEDAVLPYEGMKDLQERMPDDRILVEIQEVLPPWGFPSQLPSELEKIVEQLLKISQKLSSVRLIHEACSHSHQKEQALLFALQLIVQPEPGSHHVIGNVVVHSAALVLLHFFLKVMPLLTDSALTMLRMVCNVCRQPESWIIAFAVIQMLFDLLDFLSSEGSVTIPLIHTHRAISCCRQSCVLRVYPLGDFTRNTIHQSTKIPVVAHSVRKVFDFLVAGNQRTQMLELWIILHHQQREYAAHTIDCVKSRIYGMNQWMILEQWPVSFCRLLV